MIDASAQHAWDSRWVSPWVHQYGIFQWVVSPVLVLVGYLPQAMKHGSFGSRTPYCPSYQSSGATELCIRNLVVIRYHMAPGDLWVR